MKPHSTFTAALVAAGIVISLGQAQTSTPQTRSGGSTGQQTGQRKERQQTDQREQTGQQQQTGQQRERQQTGTAGRAQEPTTSTADRNFLIKSAHAGMAEVKMAELAAERASSEEVKEYARHILEDHQKANERVKDIASQQGITLPSDMDAKQKAAYDRLSKLSGEEFDRAFTREMVRDHKQDVSEFRRASKTARNPEVKEFASNTLPTLQQHLKRAQELSGGTMADRGARETARPGEDQRTQKERRANGTKTREEQPQKERK